MTWDNGPWAVDGGATSADVGRLVAWHAVNGATGVGNPTDLRVRAKDTPDGHVVVGPGTCAVPTRALGKSFQVYVGSNPTDDTLDIPATTSSGPRSDLIVARVENPITGEPWTPPDDPINGQYIFTRRIPNVGSSVTDIGQVDPSASAITLARVDIPSNTSAITNGMIIDLRKTIAPPVDAAATFTSTQVFVDPPNVLSPPPLGAGYRETAWVNWPTLSSWNVPVPSWATKAELFYIVNPALDYNGWGGLRFLFNSRPGVYNGFDVNFPLYTASGTTTPVALTNAGGLRTQYMIGDVFDVLPTERGTTIPIRTQGMTHDDTVYQARGTSWVGRGAVGYVSITFKKAATAS